MNEILKIVWNFFCGAEAEESPQFIKLSLHCLTVDEKQQINHQFQGDTWRLNAQVLWTGMDRSYAQVWADKRDMQTLTTAMGPLMKQDHPNCLKRGKSANEWSRYMKGASAMFAWHIAKSQKVTVLSPPPPWKYHPSGLSNFQLMEEPVVKGRLGGKSVDRIYMVHPTVKGAEDFYYQIWPSDETHLWVERFAQPSIRQPSWREVKLTSLLEEIVTMMQTFAICVARYEYSTSEHGILSPKVRGKVTIKGKQAEVETEENKDNKKAKKKTKKKTKKKAKKKNETSHNESTENVSFNLTVTASRPMRAAKQAAILKIKAFCEKKNKKNPSKGTKYV
jgi:hypothetical protein